MKRRIIASLLASVITFMTFTGCSQKGGAGDETTTGTTTPTGGNDSTEEVELTVWESTDGPDEWIKRAGAAFTEKYPNVKIKYVNVELGDTTTQIALDGPAGVGPDLFAAPHDKLGELKVGGHVLPTVDDEEVANTVLGACSAALTYDGTMYGYPTSAETYALYYNKDLISEDEVPKTWDQLISWCETFNKGNAGKHGFMMDVGNIYYSILFSTYGGNRMFGESGLDTSSSYLATESSIKGFEQFQKVKSVLDVNAADLTTSVCDGAFAAGETAMYISGPWNVATFTSAGIDFGVTTIPSILDEKTPAASFSGTRGMFVSAYSKHPKEAAAFAKFLLTDEMQQLRYEITGALPSTNITVDSPISQGFISQLDYAFPMPSVPQMAAFWESGNASSANIWNGADAKKELEALDAAIVSYVAQ